MTEITEDAQAILMGFLKALWVDNDREPLVLTNRAHIEVERDSEALCKLLPFIKRLPNGDLALSFVTSVEEAKQITEQGI